MTERTPTQEAAVKRLADAMFAAICRPAVVLRENGAYLMEVEGELVRAKDRAEAATLLRRAGRDADCELAYAEPLAPHDQPDVEYRPDAPGRRKWFSSGRPVTYEGAAGAFIAHAISLAEARIHLRIIRMCAELEARLRREKP